MPLNIGNAFRTGLSKAKSFANNAGRLGEQIDSHAGALGTVANALKPSLVANTPFSLRPLSLAAQGKYVDAAASLAGTPGEVALSTAKKALKTTNRAYGMGLSSPKQLAAATARGTLNGLVSNRRNILDAATGGAVTLAQGVNSLVKNRYGHTALGKTLTSDISSPVYEKLQLKQNLRKVSGGFFYMCDTYTVSF